MTDSATLLQLAARVEGAEAPSRELDAWIEVALNDKLQAGNTLEAEQSATDETEWSIVEREPDGRRVDRFAARKFTASLDAALSLVPEGWAIQMTVPLGRHTSWVKLYRFDGDNDGHQPSAARDGTAATPALALCAAALKARASQEDGNG